VRRIPTVAALAITALTLADDVRADAEPALVLPMCAALAIVARPAAPPVAPIDLSAASARWRGRAPGTPPPPPEFIPKRIHIPDRYAIDYERDAPRFAEPVDAKRRVAFELLPSTRRRPSLAFIYDVESLPIGDSSDRVSVRFELPF
jgi:hypothetical protein